MEKREGCKSCSPLVFSNISVARWHFRMRFGALLEPSILDEMTLRVSKVQPVIDWRHRKWRWGKIPWWKCDKLGDHWIKGRKSPLMGANSTLLRMFFENAKITTAGSSCPVHNSIDVQPEMKMADVKQEVGYLYLNLQMEYMWNFYGIRIFVWVEQQLRMLVMCDVILSEKSKMAACIRKWVWNNEYF